MSKGPNLDEMTRGLVAFGHAWADAARSYCGHIERAFIRAIDPAADPRIENLAVILNEAEMETVKATIRSERIGPEWAAKLIAFGCPPDRLGDAALLAHATGREDVLRWCVDGRIDEALTAMSEGRIGDLYEDQP
jgi:hypothetical protein